jgi:ketosteroid isomerase-like protein
MGARDTWLLMPEESTTPDLVELTRGLLEAMDRDWDLDALAEFFAPDAVWDLSALGLGTYEGWAAIREMFAGWWANWEDHHHKIEEIRDLGHGVVFLVIWEDGRPVGGEGRVQARHGDVNEWVRGKLVRVTSSYDIDEARAAAERLAEERG